MQAVYFTGHGGNEVVAVGERPTPEPGPGEVRVRLNAATFNRVDLYMRDSGAGITHQVPQIFGLDSAGVVDALGPGATGWSPGDRVVLYPALSCQRCEFCLRGQDVLCTSVSYLGEHRDGSFAEFVCVPARNLHAWPQGLDAAEAAALGVNHLTAWRMLFTQAQLQAGETVLVFGVGGGVSLAALQLAKMAGARVAVTSRSADKLARALALGADHAIDGSQGDIAKQVLAWTGGRGVDVVFENVGEAVWGSALKSLVRGGRLVTCGATTGDQPGADLRRLFIRQLRIFGSTLGTSAEFAELLRAVQLHRLKPVIDRRYTFDTVREGFSRLEAGEQFGKLALEIRR